MCCVCTGCSGNPLEVLGVKSDVDSSIEEGEIGVTVGGTGGAGGIDPLVATRSAGAGVGDLCGTAVITAVPSGPGGAGGCEGIEGCVIDGSSSNKEDGDHGIGLISQS